MPPGCEERTRIALPWNSHNLRPAGGSWRQRLGSGSGLRPCATAHAGKELRALHEAGDPRKQAPVPGQDLSASRHLRAEDLRAKMRSNRTPRPDDDRKRIVPGGRARAHAVTPLGRGVEFASAAPAPGPARGCGAVGLTAGRKRWAHPAERRVRVRSCGCPPLRPRASWSHSIRSVPCPPLNKQKS